MDNVFRPEFTSTDTQDALMAGAAMVDPKSVSMPGDRDACTPFVVVPDGYRIESLAHLFPKPQRRCGHTVLLDTKSFIQFVNEESERSFGHMRLFGTKESGKFWAVFNDDGYGDHTAEYTCADPYTAWDQIARETGAEILHGTPTTVRTGR